MDIKCIKCALQSGFDAGFLYECDFAESESAEKSESYGEPQRWIEIPAIDDMPISFYSQW